MKTIDGNFFDENYFENGIKSGKSWLVNYHWMPKRSFREAFAYIDYLKLDERSYVLDFGCAKGFTVKALRELEIMADGCDISEYALSFAPLGCWNCLSEEEWENRCNKYTHIISKDVFEHMCVEQLEESLQKLSKIAPILMCIVPIGDNGTYRIKEYHMDASHLIAEDENWWANKFKENGWNIKKECQHVKGLKDNWYNIKNGNHVYVLEKK